LTAFRRNLPETTTGGDDMLFYIDTETTGLFDAEMVECAVIDDTGKTILDTLVNPGRPIPVGAMKIHGITDDMVRNAPRADAVRAFVLELVAGHEVVIYNASYDTMFLPGIRDRAAAIHCCMMRYAPVYDHWDDYHESYTWAKLGVAAERCGHVAVGDAHRARADALACRTVWQWLEAHKTEKQS
jgi:DNA polymerase-3 subunit epsilon